ncbi:hypothetical protein EV121DRAFT_283091 [Schizophyllum commune]
MQSRRRRPAFVFAATTSSPRYSAIIRPYRRSHRPLVPSLVIRGDVDVAADTPLPSHHHFPDTLLRRDVSLVVHRHRRGVVLAAYSRLSSLGDRGHMHESEPCWPAPQARLMADITDRRGHTCAPSMGQSTSVEYPSPCECLVRGYFIFKRQPCSGIFCDPEPPRACTRSP